MPLSAPLLLFNLGWLSLAASHQVAARPGGDATLLCSNFSSAPTQIWWFRVTAAGRGGSGPRRLASLFSAADNASYSSEAESGKYRLWSNSSTLFLAISRLETSDAGFYFCGYVSSKHPVVVSTAYLTFQEGEGEGRSDASLLILSGVTLALTKVIVGLAVRMSHRHTGSGGYEDEEDGVLMAMG